MQNNLMRKDVLVPTLAQDVRRGTLFLEDGSRFEGISFGYEGPVAGEVVFCTGMVGYPEALTDPSYRGQILTMTYPLVGNYGVPTAEHWESSRIHASGLIVSDYIDTPSHAQSAMTLRQWLQSQQIPALEIKDTRGLTQYIRTHGTMLGKIVLDEDIPFHDPNTVNLVAEVSVEEVVEQGEGETTIVVLDCGVKRNIERSLVDRGVRVITVPWDYDLFGEDRHFDFDGIVISNGPGNPHMAEKAIATVRTALEQKVPMLGICLGHQLLALAAGGQTHKLKFGHRSQNQPCLLQDSKRCYITTQNHGFVVKDLPPDFAPWFTNANDGSNEGMRHVSEPVMSVQFHPEATPGPEDTEWIFDYYLERVRN